MFSRSNNDDRNVRDVVKDVSHDLYHRVAKLDKGSEDGQTGYRHAGDCEWTRANED